MTAHAGSPGAAWGREAPSAWLFLSEGRPVPPGAPLPDALAAGALVMELAWPAGRARVLLDWQSETSGYSLSVFHDPAAGLAVMHRARGQVRRCALPGQLPSQGPTARLALGWDIAADRWSLTLTAGGDRASICGRGPPVPCAAALSAMCAGRGLRTRDHAVLWYGVTDRAAPPPPAPAGWIGQQTPVETPQGGVAAGRLRVGDLVATLDHGPMPIAAIRRFDLPAGGAQAPVLLRAPWFARCVDLLVSADQLVLRSGAAVEYLYGEDAVLVPASAMVDGRAALSDNRRAVAQGLSLDLGCDALIGADGCGMAVTHSGLAPRRLLTAREAAPLLAFGAQGGLDAAG